MGALAASAGAWIPIPGFEWYAFSAGETWDSVVPPTIGPTTMVHAVVALRLLLAVSSKSESELARSVGLVALIGFAASQSLTMALWAESTNSLGGQDFVDEPGWRFRLIAMLTCVAGGSVLFWLADRIDDTRIATGALMIVAIDPMVQVTRRAVGVAASVSVDGADPLEAIAIAALPLSIVALSLALARRAPSSWPVPLAGSLALRSGLDVVAFPSLIASLASHFVEPHAGRAMGAALVIGGTAALMVRLGARASPDASRRVRWAWLPAGAALGLVAVPFIASLAPTAPEGQRVVLTLAATERFGEGEPAAMVDRLNALGMEARVVSATELRITLVVEHAPSTEAVMAGLRPRAVSFRLAVPLAEDVHLPAGIRRPSGAEPVGPCPSIRSWAPSAPCPYAIEDLALEGDGAVPRCVLRCLAAEQVIGPSDIADAFVDERRSDEPRVVVTLHPAGADRLARVTADNHGREMVIAMGHEVITAPVIRGAVSEGEMVLTLGGFRSYDQLLTEAEAIASAIRYGARQPSHWTVESIARR